MDFFWHHDAFYSSDGLHPSRLGSTCEGMKLTCSYRLCTRQVVLINAVKDVAKALGNLISTTKAAAGKPYDDPSMLQLKNSAKVRLCMTYDLCNLLNCGHRIFNALFTGHAVKVE